MERQPRVLVVDDEPLNIDYLEQELEELGYEIASAANGRAALVRVAAEPPDVILLDIRMPEMDGFQVLQHLQADERHRDIPVIVISALDDRASIVRGIELGAQDYLSKPFDPVVLKARLGACVERKQLRDREVLYLQRVNQELDLAWQVQAGFLPDRLPDVPGWQLAATLIPSRQTSGDFYDLIPLPGGHLGVLVADVADKGMGAALYMVLSRTLIRTYAVQYHQRPDLVLAVANERVLSDIDTNQFVTVFYGIIDPVTGSMAYCNAGHNPPYLVSAAAGGEVQQLTKTGMALGVLEDQSWERRVVQIDPGDVLVLYTDGITEAQDVRGAFFDEARLLAAVRAHGGEPAQGVCDGLLAEVREFMGDAPQMDDITLVVVARDRA